MIEVEWERNEYPSDSPVAGWRALVGGRYIGTVYADGDVFFGPPGRRGLRSITTQPIAAQALVRYVEAGGR